MVAFFDSQQVNPFTFFFIFWFCFDLRSFQSNLPKQPAVSSLFWLGSLDRLPLHQISVARNSYLFLLVLIIWILGLVTVSSDFGNSHLYMLRATDWNLRFLPVHWYHPFWLYSSTRIRVLQYGILYKSTDSHLFISQNLVLFHIFSLTTQPLLWYAESVGASPCKRGRGEHRSSVPYQRDGKPVPYGS